jgi:hypothetical protein
LTGDAAANANWNTHNTVAQLKEELGRQGLPLTGKKVDLFARLNAGASEDAREVNKGNNGGVKRERDGNSS